MYKIITQRLPILFLLFLLAGCSSPFSQSIEHDITVLTSDECDGRLVGTEGNQYASTYLSDQFQGAKLSYFSDNSFFIPYTQTIFDPATSTQTITAHYADGTTKTFVAGDDFYPLGILGTRELSGPVSKDPNGTDMENTILLSDVAINTPCLVNIIPSERAVSNFSYPSGQKLPSIGVNQTVFQQLETSVSLTIHSNLVAQEVELPNVVGVLPGKTSEKALIVTAHFDHVGSFADTIYRGALDNASGVSVLLELMRQLSAQEERPEFDVIFCALNGEDSGLWGGKAFAARTLPYQTVNVLNLDTIGMKGIDKLSVEGDSAKLAAQINDFLNAEGIPSEFGAFGSGDHISFQAEGLAAINLSSYGLTPYDIIHTPEDTIEGLDLDYLNKLATVLCQYVLSQEILEDTPTVKTNNSEIFEQAYQIAAEALQTYRPTRNQVVAFSFLGDRFFTRDCSPIHTLKEISEIWPKCSIPQKIGTFSFQRLHFLTRMDDMSLRREPDTGKDLAPEVLPLMPNDQLETYCLDYVDAENRVVTIIIYDNRRFTREDMTVFYEVEEIEMDGYSLLYLYTTPQKERVLNQIAVYNESLPCSFSLNSTSLPAESLQAFIVENIALLSSFSPIDG